MLFGILEDLQSKNTSSSSTPASTKDIEPVSVGNQSCPGRKTIQANKPSIFNSFNLAGLTFQLAFSLKLVRFYIHVSVASFGRKILHNSLFDRKKKVA